MALVVLYLIGKPFYNSAAQNDKNKWLFAQFGILVFFIGGALLSSLVTLLLMVANIARSPENETIIAYSTLFAGMFCHWTFKRFLVRHWNKKRDSDDTILDDI